MGLVAVGDPMREAWFAWSAKEVVRQFYDRTPRWPRRWSPGIARGFGDESMPFEVRRLRRTIAKWATQIVVGDQ